MNKPLFSNNRLTRRRLGGVPLRVPMRVIVPNVVTLLALCLGITAIRFAIEQQFTQAVLCILGAAVFDGLDGRIARALKGTTRFGAELDSLADFIDFGVAPAIVLYLWSLESTKSFGWFAVLVYAVACALRLARFNVTLDEEASTGPSSRFFTGMPAPAGALVVLLPLYLHLSALALPNLPRLVPFQIAYVLVVAFLMVSRIPHFSGKTIGRIPREHVGAVMFAGAVAILLLFTFPMEMLIVLTLGYFALIPLSIRQARKLREAEDVGQIH
ncbi:MAG: CDP-diacylglycerol--serine O-phosphatidyltransferase [Hyphomicrobiales bacterium]|nr:CDP-diacylglycerol--serine O-phosphatidyltransferase [Hyphomicrobiales bacterium]MDE2113776.1 CDP-diacylglycerol--serine O-phosphatidyltransferase [Hyphomicrobiales bacterium]